MKKIFKWLGTACLVLLLLTVGVVWALQRWVGSDAFKVQTEKEISSALGVGVTLTRIDVAVWPLPAVALEGVQVQTQPVLTLERLEARPIWRSLLQGELKLATMLVRDAVLPQVGVDGLLLLLQKMQLETSAPSGKSGTPAATTNQLPRRLVLSQVTWVGAQGATMTLDADAHLSAQGLPDEVSVQVLKGLLQGSHAQLKRHNNDWTLTMAVGGGTVDGYIQWQPAAQVGAPFALQGQLKTRAVSLAALSTASPPVLSGQLDMDTTLTAHTSSLGALADELKTQSQFTVRQAVLHGIDLAKAVSTLGLSRGGETRLNTLAGQANTQGRAVQLTQMAASSGLLSASGHVAIAPISQTLSGRVNVDMAASALGGAVGVPLNVGGTLAAPELTLTRGALVGAAIGTAVMPGAGTGAGLSIGDRLEQGFKKLFGQ